MAEGMLRSDDVHMVPNDVMQIPFDWLGDLMLKPVVLMTRAKVNILV